MPDSGAYSPKLFADRWEEACGPFRRGPIESGLVEEILRQEAALREYYPARPFLPEQLAALREDGVAGGAEHEVFVPDGSKRVWKITRPQRWGLIRATPLEYLERLQRLDAASGTEVRVEGIAIDDNDNPQLVTTMEYVHGRHLVPTDLHAMLLEQGWSQIADPDSLQAYQHESGMIMRDAHAKNFIYTLAGALVPVDVIFIPAS